MTGRRLYRRGAVFVLAAVWSAPLAAQGWLPERGEGTLTLTYQGLLSETHLDRNGNPFNPARITGNTVLLGLDYGLGERVALDVKVAWVANKYEGADRLHGPVDTGAYHRTLQDARFAVRYSLRSRGAWVVAPFAGAILPTHGYETRGHSAPGRRLKALQLGIGVGRDIELLARNAYVHAQYNYAFVERVERMYIDRSNADAELGYAVTPRLTLTAAATFQFTHGGLTFPLPRDDHFHIVNPFHDRVAKASFTLVTGGGTFAVSRTVDLYVTGVWTVSGRNTHAVRGMSAGTAWTFGRGLGAIASPALQPPRVPRFRAAS